MRPREAKTQQREGQAPCGTRSQDPGSHPVPLGLWPFPPPAVLCTPGGGQLERLWVQVPKLTHTRFLEVTLYFCPDSRL